MTMLLALLLNSPVGISEAQADELENLDSSSSSERSKRKRRTAEDEVVREVVRGYFLKANVGTTGYLLARGGGLLNSGTTLGLAGGSDFIDNERFSLSWEVAFEQGLHNGAKYDQQDPSVLGPNRLIQGDIHSFAALAFFEASFYPTRRFGVGVRAGGGVMLTPLLMFPEAYENIVIAQNWGVRPAVHDQPHPLVGGGPTFEYYTKLSHFSLGLDTNVFYAIGLDLGYSATGYLKYTF